MTKGYDVIPKLLSLKDAASRIAISYSTIFGMAQRGEIKTIKIAYRRFVAVEVIDSFLREAKDPSSHEKEVAFRAGPGWEVKAAPAGGAKRGRKPKALAKKPGSKR